MGTAFGTPPDENQGRSALDNNSKKPQNNAEHARWPQSSHHSKSIQAFCATKYVAIIIAMKNYEKKRSIPGSEGFEDIPEVIDDMKNIKKGLKGLGGCNFDIRTFENASLKELKQLQRDLIFELTTNEKQGERTCLFFYYAGHGMQNNYTFAVLNEERNYPMEKNLRILANTPRAYVVALLDCCRENMPNSMRGGYADQSIPEDEEGQNLVITFGCPPSEGTPVKSTIATAYFECLREGAEQDGSVLVPQALIGWRGTDGKCETLPLIKQPLKLMIYDNAQIDNISAKAQEVRDKIGEFSYDDHEYESQLGQREKRQMVILEDGAQYEGEWLLGTQIRQGKGRLIEPDGSIYEGYWADNKRNGKGRLIHADGDVYEGDYVEGCQQGRGCFTWADKSTYTGDYNDDNREGYGVYQWPDGGRYEGDWVNNKQEGHGVKQWPNGDRYEGDWVNNKQEGHGVYQWPDGDRYEGDWVNDKQEGHGVFQWPDGSRYEGDWVNNNMEGHGVYQWPDGTRYEGDWVNNNMEGHGVKQWPDGRRYEGDWVNDKQEGHGVHQWPDGRRYEGDWVNNNMEGHGVHQWPDGRRYEGDWVNDNMEGHGVKQWPDGSRFEGQFENNQQHGVGTYTNVEGKARKGQWSEGERTAWL